MRSILVLVFVLILVSVPAVGQTLATAETAGSGKTAVVGMYDRDYAGAWLDGRFAFVRGLSDSFDLYLLTGHTRVGGEGQWFIAGGGNLHLLGWQGTHLAVNPMIATPVTNRNKASVAWFNPALIVSQRLVGTKLIAYAAANVVVPLGKTERGVFTPAETYVNWPVGLAATFGQWSVLAEFDIGGEKTRAVAIAVAYLLPK